MADPLAPLTALGNPDPLSETQGPWTLTEVSDVAMASLAIRRGGGAEVARAAQSAGIPLPGPGEAATVTKWSAFWLAPDQWMLEIADMTRFDIVPPLRLIFRQTASITEQTDAWVRFDLTGPDLPRLFERLCNIDLARMPAGRATRTVIHHLGCHVIRRGETLITVLGPRSSAASLHHALHQAAVSAA